MDTLPNLTNQTMQDGFNRACTDFTQLTAPLGFSRLKARFWMSQADGFTDIIHFHRSGVSYGAPLNYFIGIRVHFASHPGQLSGPIALNGPCSNKLRDSRGYAYDLRFNALTWSTYDRCLNDLIRVLQDHGLPWHATQRI